MAPAEGSPYLPALESCLEGKKHVLYASRSWRQAYRGIAEDVYNTNQAHLQSFFDSQAARDALQNVLNRTSPNTQAEFDSYTAAINVPHNGNGQYDIQQIKSDAHWLSKHVHVDLVSALRITMLEWHSRPSWKLTSTSTQQESAGTARGMSLQSSLLQSSVRVRELPQSTTNGDFDSETARRSRLFSVWSEEIQYRSKTLEHILGCATEPAPMKRIGQNPQIEDGPLDLDGLLADSATAVLQHWGFRDGVSDLAKGWLGHITSKLQHLVQRIYEGCTAFEGDGTEETDRLWATTLAVEAGFLLRAVTTIVQATDQLPSPSDMDSWFGLMDEINFFDDFETILLSSDEAPAYCLRSLATISTLAVLNVPLALQIVPDLSQLSASQESAETSYLHSPKTVESVTDVLLRSAIRGSGVSQPIALAWSILLQSMRSKASVAVENRENRQSLRALENLNHSQVSDTESNDSYSERARPGANRRTSFGSDTSQQGTLLEGIIDRVQKIDSQEDVIQFLARSAFSGPGAFTIISSLASTFCLNFGEGRHGLVSSQIRLLLLRTVEIALDFVEYGSDIVSSVLAILTCELSGVAETATAMENSLQDPVQYFLRSSAFMEKIFDQALCRFPYELSPLLSLCTALMKLTSKDTMSQFAVEVLKLIHTYAAMIPDNGYDIFDDDANYVVLKSPLFVDWSPHSLRGDPVLLFGSGSFRQATSNGCSEIPIGSQGLALTDSRPVVARFDVKFSGYRFLGRILQRASKAYFGPEKPYLNLILEPAVEILRLLTGVFEKAKFDRDCGFAPASEMEEIFESLNDGLEDSTDFISIVFNIFENELQEPHATSSQGDSTEVLVACVKFTQALLHLNPSRVWPFLGRSSLLGLDGVESRLLNVVASCEVPTGRFPLLKASVRLFHALINDVIRHCVSRRQISSSVARFGEKRFGASAAGIKDAMMAKILHTFTKLMIDVFETAKTWRSTLDAELPDIYTTICAAMDEMLDYAFTVDDNKILSEKLTGVLAPAVEYIVRVFLFNHHNNVPIEPFVQILGLPTNLSESVLEVVEQKSRTRMSASLLGFAEHLVIINAYIGHARSQLEAQLFMRVNSLITVFASNWDLRLPVVKLLHVLLLGSSQTSQEQPSLLGHLGQDVAINFLDLLASIDLPLGNIELTEAVWKLTSAVVTQQQQWFAILILSGETARQYLRKEQGSESVAGHKKSLLDIALNKLRHLDVLEPREAVSVLDFVYVASDHWPWVSKKIESNDGLIEAFINLLKRLGNSRPANATATSISRSHKLQMVASITKVFAIIVHRGNEAKDTSMARHLSPYLPILIEEASPTMLYNASLHASLQRNFEAKFSNCSTSNIKKTSVAASKIGANFYYDVDFANKVFAFDKSWSRGDGRGFADEFERANTNLSYVQAQITLFGSWKSLAAEMALALPTDKTTQNQLIDVVKACLEANQESSLPDKIFGNLAQSRSELAFVLLQNLIKHSTSSKLLGIVSSAWNALQSQASDLAVGLTGPEAEYTRVHLKILYLALQSYQVTSSAEANATSQSQSIRPDNVAVVLDVLGNGVAHGFRSLVTLLHDEPGKVLPTDLAVLNAILRSCLKISDVTRQSEQLMMYFSDNNTTQYATTLFSWCDRLLVDGDPVYGSLSIAFLLELSAVPALAETIVLSGTLGQLSASNLMSCFSKPGGTGPLEQPMRVHAIWSRGILPLAINLLHAIGAAIAGDIAAFLNQFKPQLERAVDSLAPKTMRGASAQRNRHITLSIASEVHSLAILCAILDAFREAGSAAGLAPGEVASLAIDRPLLISDLETVLQRRNALRDDIVAMDEREEVWSRQKPESAQSGCDNLLEEKVVEELKGALSILNDGQ